MNIFVLSTGRCGSTTFERACRHIANYSTAHESRVGCLGSDRLNYPDNHIESDNRLSWFLGRLGARYGDEAVYVHLTRDPKKVASSFARRAALGQFLFAYGNGVYLRIPYESKIDSFKLAMDYIDTVNQNIEAFLLTKKNKLRIDISDPKSGFQEFWRLIGAQGDFQAALSEFDVAHNATPNVSGRAKKALSRLRRIARHVELKPIKLKLVFVKIYRIVRYFPSFVMTI